MTIPREPLPAPPGRVPWRRLLDDVTVGVAGCAWAAVLLTLVSGRPSHLFSELVYCNCIGLVAMLILGTVRLYMCERRGPHANWLKPYLLLAIVVAPIAHRVGITLASSLLGDGFPRMADYPPVKMVSEILFTLIAIDANGFVIWNREHIARIQAERLEARARAETIERQAAQAQLRLLQAQIEPHMLFNTLANLQGLIAIDPAQASRMLDQLIRYLRATLSATRAERTLLADEFAAAEAYLGLMKVRMGERLSYRCALPPELRTASVPAMLLQPLIENAVLHGLEPKIDGGEIQVAARVRGGKLELSVRDTGPGLDAAPGPKGSGVGLSTTRERLAVLYGGRAALTLDPGEPHGVLARLTLPLETA